MEEESFSDGADGREVARFEEPEVTESSKRARNTDPESDKGKSRIYLQIPINPFTLEDNQPRPKRKKVSKEPTTSRPQSQLGKCKC